MKLLDNFKGKFVVILLSSVSMAEHDPETGVVSSGSVLIEGWVIDKDDVFLYLGDNEKDISDAVQVKDIARITLHTENIADMHDIGDQQWN